MKTQSSDTSPEAEQVQIALIRQASPERRFSMLRSITAATRQMAWQAIRRANPTATDEEINLLFLEVHYGQELARAVG